MTSVLYAQEKEEKQSEGAKRHKLMLVMGNVHVPAGINIDGDKAWTVVPSWGLDYDYALTEQWAIGMHTDMAIESYEYEEDIIYKRTRPFSMILTGSRKFGEHLTVMAGGGVELAKEEDLTIVRVGIDYGWELQNDWELSASLMSDFKIDAYNSWILGLGVGKRF
ncbi:hypothetical protein [Reichenbachiella sp. 5M10]|uniref:hypothetical protein n=1 Tax=Reichenbachiella sp. 5M10 TaxID=1889772 RepID=UPI00117B7016|nr:hypothetical protein [Reichenbachiella sp. 5M10]